MQNKNNDSEIEVKLLNNSLLFSSIRKNKTPEEKIKKMIKYLDRGADINAADINYKNNTPLHVAVLKEESEIVSFLLERGALVSNKNSDNQTALDIARRSDKSTCQRKYIVSVLEAFDSNKFKRSYSQQDLETNSTRKSHPKSSKIIKDRKYLQAVACGIENQTQCQDVNNRSSVTNRSVDLHKPKHQECSKQLKNTKRSKIFHYQKRTGTSGLSGQLYETKLLSLILFRALCVQDIKTFLIATNVESVGAFDDIIFKFHSNKSDKPKIMFVQAKHRDNPARDKFTVEEIMKLNGDFSLHKYLESYIKISQMFVPENNDDMFRGEFKNMDCEFIIYTSAFEKFSKMKSVEQTECKRFINTSKGKVFQFDYNDQDVELLVQTVAKSRAVLLAKRLSKFIFKDNHSNMMMDDLIKTYHVFLAGQILVVEVKDGESQNNFHYAKFRESFFSSNDNLLMAFKATICKEILLQKKNISPEKLDELESFLMALTFKVPVNFGNLNFCFSGSEQKKEKKLEYVCSIFKKLFENANVSANIVMKVDDNMIGPNEILQTTDLESYRLGGLVGNLLVFDNETKTLKFSSDVDTLSEDNLKLFEKLKSDVYIGIDLSKCRFDINVHRFPRLSLIHDEYDKGLINDFLVKLFFYTNQATEDEVEMILKKEIDENFVSSIPRQSEALFRVKGDAIFLKVHDRIQKWWKQSISAPYLTESCEYFYEAEQDILNSPLLSILNVTYTKNISDALPALKYKDTALELLHLDSFFSGAEKILSIITEENALSSIKLIQYFKERNFNDYTFIDLDYVGAGNYFVDVKSEIKESKINTLIVVCKSQDVIAEIVLLIKYFEGKILIIYNRDLATQINGLVTEKIVERVDSQIGFKDLADTICTMLLEKRYIVFQGNEVRLGILFEDESYHLINSKVLYMIINNKKITIGNCFNNPAYDEILDFYINGHVCRYVTLHPNFRAIDELNVLKCNELGDDFTPDTRDIVLITDKQEEFTEFIKKYVNCNVHWFSFSGDECFVWKKSRGSLLKILKYIHRGSHVSYTLQPVTLKDLREKVVIISAEPGMGKSSLLTHLAINTKLKYPALWISKINLLENTKALRRMKENKVKIDLKKTVQYLFQVIGFEAYKKSPANFEIIIDQVSVIGNDIHFNKNNVDLNLTGLNLFEIELFIHCYNNDRVVLLFDGFDEICPDFANEFMQLVNILKKSKVVHLWITSRLYNVLHQIENTLETFSFTIERWSYDNQLKFLEKIWESNQNMMFFVYRGNMPANRMWYDQNNVSNFLNYLSYVLCDENNNFISMPLHLFMISDIFKDSFRNCIRNPEGVKNFRTSQNTINMVNLNKLYEQFVVVKFFKIRFGTKKPLLCINDPDMRKLIDNERAAFYNSHKIIAAYVIFGKTENELFDSHDLNEIRDFIERIKVGEEKTGIIEQIIQNEPKFVHYTFAEYFATEFLCDRLKSFHCKTSLWMYFINTFLQSEEGEGPRKFFNSKLGNDPLMMNEIHNSGKKKLFENLLTEHLTLYKLIYKAIDENFVNIVMFLLKCLKTVLSKKNLDNFINVVSKNEMKNEKCIVCIAVERSANNIVKFIIKLIKDIDVKRLIDLFNCSDVPKFNPVLIAYREAEMRRELKHFNDKSNFYCVFHDNQIVNNNLELLDNFLSDLTSPAIAELFCIQFDYKCLNENKSQKFIHLISRSLGESYFKCFDKALEKLNKEQLITIFCVRDSEMKLAAHRAAIKQSYTFFDKLDSLLDRSQFTEICMSRDSSGLTPIHYFEYSKEDCEKLKILLDKVYEGNTDEKLTLNHFIQQKH